jgi:hypothetical protein
MIGRQNPDGSITAIYSHSNNYVEANGWLLATHYADSALVDQLIALEAISEVGLTIGTQHAYSHEQVRTNPGGWLNECLSFYRDRGETDVRAETIAPDAWPLLASDYDSEMVFLWTGLEWCCAVVKGAGDHARFGPWKRLLVQSDGSVIAQH